jgi:hypothetical protein
MKSLLAATMMLAAIALGAGDSRAQTTAVTPGAVGSTSPLGTGLGGFAPDPQSATLPLSGTATPDPCSTASNGPASNGTAALPTFDGGGMSLAANSAISALPGAYGVGTSSTAPCNSVSSSGVMSSPSSPTATSTGANTSAPSSPSSSSGASAIVGTTGLGTTALGTTGGLGTIGLGSSPTMSASTPPTTSPSTSVVGSPIFCSGTQGMTNASINPTAGADGNASGVVSDPTQGVAGGIYDPAQILGGEASVPGPPCVTGE